MEKEDGVWRTIRGRRVFIAKGESLGQAMARSGKFNRADIRETKAGLSQGDRFNKAEKGNISQRRKAINKMRSKDVKYSNSVYTRDNQDPKNRINENEERRVGNTRVAKNYFRYSEADRREFSHEKIQKKLADYKAKKQSNNKVESGLTPAEEKELRENYSNNAEIDFGKVDYNGTGRKINKATIEMELKNGRFSASGNVWNSKGTDIIAGGQMIDDLEPYFKGNKDYATIRDMWKKYHLNDMHAGTEKQENALEQFKHERKAIAESMNKGKKYDWEKVSENDYSVSRKLLENHKLLKDDGYEYGTGWLKRDIPAKDLKTIKDLIEKYKKRKG